MELQDKVKEQLKELKSTVLFTPINIGQTEGSVNRINHHVASLCTKIASFCQKATNSLNKLDESQLKSFNKYLTKITKMKIEDYIIDLNQAMETQGQIKKDSQLYQFIQEFKEISAYQKIMN